MYQHILVPTDGSLLAARTVGSAVEFAQALRARITFLYVEPDLSADLYGEAALLHAMDPEQFDEKYRLRAREILSKAEAVSQAAGVPCSGISGVSDSPHEVIIEAAGRQGCDLIYMSSRGWGGAAGMMMGSETLKTVLHAAIPVLIYSIGANAPLSVRALSVIQDEHQAIAAVGQKLQSFAAHARRRGIRPEVANLRQVIAYFRDFPAKYHHPKEEDHLFARLAARTHEVDGPIAELKRQHQAEQRLLEELGATLEQLAADAASSPDAFCDAADRFVAHLWTHMSLEEEVIFPAAKKHLTREDWEAIEAAFRGNGKEGFADTGARLLKLAFARIVNILDT